MTTIQAALFDLGGTLLDFNPEGYAWLEWERIGLTSAHAFLSAQGHALDREAFIAHFMDALPRRWTLATQGKQNLTLDGLLQEACIAGGKAVPAADIRAAIPHYIAPLDQRVAMYDDTLGTIQALHARGLKIGLISNTMWPGDEHRREMERFGFLHYFHDTLFSGDVALWKPQPELYQLALDRLGVLAERAFFVGDTPEHDLVGAQAVGMKTVYKRNTSFALDGVHPDAEITHLAELLELIERW